MSPALLFKNELYIKALCQYILDGCGEHLMNKIFKIDHQKSLSKFL